jgi:hypothetical protein
LKQRRGQGLLLAAALLLACVVAWVFWSSREVRVRREATLAGVPAFPQPRQELPQRKPMVRPQIAKPAEAHPRQDSMLSFVHGSSGTVTLIHVNALFNTPLAERFRQCMPKAFQEMEKGSGLAGVDLTRDIDQVAMVPDGGVVISGFFKDTALADQPMKPGSKREEYRGATIISSQSQCVAQRGNLVIVSSAGDCPALLDRALAPTPDSAQDEIYGDLYMRSDLAALHDDSTPSALKPLVDGLSGLTLRANVWDSVALSFEGSAASGKDAGDLAQMARGAVELFKSQLDDDQVELQALAELAKVNTSSGRLEMSLALPAADLFDKLHIPCPGIADAGVQP